MSRWSSRWRRARSEAGRAGLAVRSATTLLVIVDNGYPGGKRSRAPRCLFPNPWHGDKLPVVVADIEPTTPPTELRCEIVRNGQAAWVQPFGELDLDSVHRIEGALEELRGDGCPEVVLDLRGLTFMDSTGLRLVIRWDSAAREDGFRFAIVPGPEVVQRVFRLTGMDDHLTVVDPPR